MPGETKSGWADDIVNTFACGMCARKNPTGFSQGDMFSEWLDKRNSGKQPQSADIRRGFNNERQHTHVPGQIIKDVQKGGTMEAFNSSPPIVCVCMHSFVAQDPRPFPPDPHGDLSMTKGNTILVFPDKTSSGWCFAESIRDGSNRGWVPGNYITRDGLNPYIPLSEMGNSTGSNFPAVSAQPTQQFTEADRQTLQHAQDIPVVNAPAQPFVVNQPIVLNTTTQQRPYSQTTGPPQAGQFGSITSNWSRAPTSEVTSAQRPGYAEALI